MSSWFGGKTTEAQQIESAFWKSGHHDDTVGLAERKRITNAHYRNRYQRLIFEHKGTKYQAQRNIKNKWIFKKASTAKKIKGKLKELARRHRKSKYIAPRGQLYPTRRRTRGTPVKRRPVSIRTGFTPRRTVRRASLGGLPQNIIQGINNYRLFKKDYSKRFYKGSTYKKKKTYRKKKYQTIY